MKLKDLIRDIEVRETLGNLNNEITDLKIDSNEVSCGSLFICLNGKDFDAHQFIKQVEMYGAAALITEKKVESSLPQVVVDNTRVAMSRIAATFYGNADKRMKIIGVSGTNGKTTTTHIIKSVLDEAGIKCGVIGTLGTFYGSVYIEPSLTTPDPIVLHKTLKDMLNSGVKVVVMEVSAHALDLNKLDGIEFEVGVFTNLTQDHLDYFETMENYKRAKLKMFENGRCKYIVANSDDKTGREIISSFDKALSYGIDNPADVFAIHENLSASGTKFIINLFDGIFDIDLKLLGRFNIYNALAAASATALLGIELETIVKAINSIESVSGRLEKIYSGKFDIYLDYAHTPDGLLNAIKALKLNCKNKLICLFGCGGNRDKTKRKIMGEISGKNADFTILTADNPRYEDTMDIIGEIEEGMLKVSKNYVAVQDRVEGIKYAIKMACDGDIILLAGKGSEKYQEILGIKQIYNDKDTVMNIIRS